MFYMGATNCNVKLLGRGRDGDTFKTPYQQFLSLPNAFLSSFGSDSLMTPPPHFKHLLLFPATIHHSFPFPIKILMVHKALSPCNALPLARNYVGPRPLYLSTQKHQPVSKVSDQSSYSGLLSLWLSVV